MFLGRPAIFWWGVGLEAALGALALALGWWFECTPLGTFRWDARDALVGILAVAPMLVGFWAGVRWPLGPLARIQHFLDEFVRPLFAPCSAMELALIALAAGLGEEMFFRGFLQQLFTERWGVPLGIALASILFGLMHLITLTYAVLAACLGVYLGMLWLLDGNLLSVVVAHAVYDFIGLVYVVKWTSGE